MCRGSSRYSKETYLERNPKSLNGESMRSSTRATRRPRARDLFDLTSLQTGGIGIVSHSGRFSAGQDVCDGALSFEQRAQLGHPSDAGDDNFPRGYNRDGPTALTNREIRRDQP